MSVSPTIIKATDIATVEEFARQAAATLAALNQPEELAKDHFGSERNPAFDYATGGADQTPKRRNWADPILGSLREYLEQATDIADELDAVSVESNDDGTIDVHTYTAIPVSAMTEGAPDATLEHSREFVDEYGGGWFEWDEIFRFTLRVDGEPVLHVDRTKYLGTLALSKDGDTAITLEEFFDLWKTYFPMDLSDLETIREL